MVGKKEDETPYILTDEELKKVLYIWDEQSSPVKEFLYVKRNRVPVDLINSTNREGHDLSAGGKPMKNRENALFDDDQHAYFTFDTTSTVHVVEYYAAWCPHCFHFKGDYIALARETIRRSMKTKVEFHAVSCELFPVVCRSYGVAGFPAVFGYKVSANVKELGIELNAEDDQEMTADTIANQLDLTLLDEQKMTQSFTLTAKERQQLSLQATEKKQQRFEFPSDIEQRYHDAAASLVFVLKHGIFTSRSNSLSDQRALALKEFLEVLDWTTPQAWSIRTGLIQDLLHHFPSVASNATFFYDLVDSHVLAVAGWGGLQSRFEANANLVSSTMKWTPACAQSQYGSGFTCGLWNLLHILSLGSSLPDHELYGFVSGYITAPLDVLEIVKRFVDYFFACDVCRRHFLENYDNCGQEYCERLVEVSPLFLDKNVPGRWIPQVEIARWFLEFHNTVNVRLMKENAIREGRQITIGEQMAGHFPPSSLCGDCWLNKTIGLYNTDEVVLFLDAWYWPRVELPDHQFVEVLTRRNDRIVSKLLNHGFWHPTPWLIAGVLVSLLLSLVFCRPKEQQLPKKGH